MNFCDEKPNQPTGRLERGPCKLYIRSNLGLGYLGDPWNPYPMPITRFKFTQVLDVRKNDTLGGGFKHCIFSPLLGEMIQFD